MSKQEERACALPCIVLVLVLVLQQLELALQSAKDSETVRNTAEKSDQERRAPLLLPCFCLRQTWVARIRAMQD
jgi:hypothetical protein